MRDLARFSAAHARFSCARGLSLPSYRITIYTPSPTLHMPETHENMRETHSTGPETREWMVHERVCPALAENQIFLTGISDAAAGFRFVRPNWPHSQVMVCFSGEGRVWSGGKWHCCGPGMAYLTPPRAISAYYATPQSRWGVCWVTYKPATNFSPVTCTAATVHKADPRPLRSAIEGLYREMNGKADAACAQGWVDLIQLYATRIADPAHHDRFWSLWEQVSSDLGCDWTVEDLAKLASTSGEHFRRLCRRQLGRTPMGHLTYLRMHRAATLLVSTDSKIEQIAETVGYSNRFSFSHAFHRLMHHTPAKYRRLFGGR